MPLFFYLCCLAIVLQGFVAFWCYTSCFKLKIKAPAAYLIYLSIYAVCTFFNFYYQYAYNRLFPLTGFIMPLFFYLPFNFLTEGKPYKKLILIIVDMVVIDTFGEYLIYMVQMFTSNSAEMILNRFDLYRFVMIITHTLVTLPMKYLLVKLWNRIVNKSNEKLNLIFMIFPLAQFLSFTLVRIEVTEEDWSFDKLAVLVAYFFVIIISCIIYLFFLSDIEKKNRLEKEYSALSYTRRLEEAHYAAIEEKQIETAKIRHDIKNQLSVIGGLLRSGDTEEAKALFDELENSVNNSKVKEYCCVPIINALLHEKEKLCEDESVSLVTDISISHTGNIPKNRLCSIFSNLIDNAVRECKALPEGIERVIKVSAAEKNGFISVRCENPVREGKENGDRTPEGSGYGMKIWNDIAHEYNGRFFYESREGKWVAKITVDIS